MKVSTSDVQTGKSNYDEVARGPGSGGAGGGYSNANATSGDAVKTGAYMPASASIIGDGGSELAPGFDGGGDYAAAPSSDGNPGYRIMETGPGVAADFPAPENVTQINLEHTGPAVKGA